MSDLTWEFNNCKHECVTYEEYVEMKKNYDNFVRSELKVTGKTGITILEYQKLMRFINDESKTQELCNIVNEVIERNEEDTTTYTREELDEMYYNYMTYVRNNEFIFLEQQKVKKVIWKDNRFVYIYE